MSQPNEKSELEILAPGRDLQLSIGTVRVRPLTLRETTEALKIPGGGEFFAALKEAVGSDAPVRAACCSSIWRPAG